MYLAVFREWLAESEMADRPIDDNREIRAQLGIMDQARFEAWMKSVQFVHRLAQCIPRHRDLFLTPCQVAQQCWYPNHSHYGTGSFAKIAFSTLSGDMGSRFMRTPTA